MTSLRPDARSDLFARTSERTPDGATAGGVDVWSETAASPDFVELRARLLRFVVPATVGFLSWFFLYIGMNAWTPELLGIRVFGGVTLVLVIAVGQFATTFAVTVLYARHAARRLDPLADRIRTRLDEQAPR